MGVIAVGPNGFCEALNGVGAAGGSFQPTARNTNQFFREKLNLCKNFGNRVDGLRTNSSCRLSAFDICIRAQGF